MARRSRNEAALHAFSETEAWEFVANLSRQMIQHSHDPVRVRELADSLLVAAGQMQDQLAHGVHRNPPSKALALEDGVEHGKFVLGEIERLAKDARNAMRGHSYEAQVVDSIHLTAQRGKVALGNTLAVWGIGKKFKSNPALVVWPNPPRDMSLGKLFSERIYSIRYKHKDDNVDYQHDFARGVQLWKARVGGQDAVIIIGGQGQPITDEF